MSTNITEKGKVGNAGSKVANAFSLQLNTQFFSGSPACSGSGNPANCLAWQQFVYAYSSGVGLVFMQYWLINYDATCPSGWFTFSSDCYTNSNASTLTPPYRQGTRHPQAFGERRLGWQRQGVAVCWLRAGSSRHQ